MTQIPLQTEEESQFIKEYILLPIILDILEKDIKTLDSVPLKMPTIYARTLRHVQDLITIDLLGIRKYLRKHGIKVYEQNWTKLGIEARYLCRGYHHQFSMLRGLVKAEVEKKLSEYLNIDLAGEINS
ncbi:hypothetical protein [Brevibacillus sp. DP1.3A]|uniref:hypothetical protein n=1 Tax=Brevibacillus sp. DP1.3A TaxID=2738867 RepID=UPI00156B0FD9|nr:hypothetical protein [Brevibacillus sp. DP1.3A]MED1916924.1 hypothetical protein [Bacillus thuringiensis]UED77221.1 hypothetical protein HP399_012365 [Brevibacillus sp. DP1.3A]